MKGTRYLSESVDIKNLIFGSLNLIKANVGCGKSYWAMNVMSDQVSNKNRMLYLIDTVNGKEQLLNYDVAAIYTNEWKRDVLNNIVSFEDDKVVVMTYAKFGVLADRYENFGFNFETIICDEIHNLIRFNSFTQNTQDKKWHEIAKERLELIVKRGKTLCIGLSATPQLIEDNFDAPIHSPPIDYEKLRRYETFKEERYTNINDILFKMEKSKVGVIYISHIEKMKELCGETSKIGFKPIAIWSIRNEKHPMTDQQRNVRSYILENQELPLPYNLYIINSSCETSINIKGKLDYMIIHSQDRDTQIQVRGRYRNDLKELYVLDYNFVKIPSEFLGVRLFAEDKKRLSEILKWRDHQGRIVKWTSIKKRLIESKIYKVEDHVSKGERYSVITY